MNINKLSDVNGKEKTKRRKQPDRKGTKGNIVLEKNKSMDNNSISTKTKEADKENMNRLKQPIQGESLKENILGEKSEMVDSTRLSKKAVGDDEVNVIRLKQPMQGESLKGSIQKGKNEIAADNKRNFNMLLDIHPYSFKWNLQARVQQKNVNYWQSKKKVKLLLIDAEGTRMEACIYNKDVDKFENKIQESKVYSFVGVRAELSPPEYKLANQSFQCLLTKETIIEEEEDEHGIPKYCFDFISLDKLVPFVGSKSVLIGEVVS